MIGLVTLCGVPHMDYTRMRVHLPSCKHVVASKQLIGRFLVSELEPVTRPHHDPMARAHQTITLIFISKHFFFLIL